jgi:hypothetical protein
VTNSRSRSKPSRQAVPTVSALDVHVLDGAEELIEAELSCLAVVARTLARHNCVVIVTYDDDMNSLRFHQQREWMPAGFFLSSDATAQSLVGRRDA